MRQLLDRCRHEVCAEPGIVNLTRWYLLRIPGLITICLHRFWRSDDWALHNHEYDSVSFILRGWYIEHLQWRGRRARSRYCWRWRPYFRPAEAFHSITLPFDHGGKVWTIFVQYRYRGPAFREGYLRAGSFVPLADYDAEHGRKPDQLRFSGWLFPRVTPA